LHHHIHRLFSYALFVFIATMSIGCSSIQRKIYAPTLVNNPSLRAKNDYSVSGVISTPTGFDLNGGYAITNRLAIIGGLFIYNNKDKEENYNYFFSETYLLSRLQYKHKGFHVGAGTILPLTKKQTTDYASFFCGYTLGGFEMQESLYGDNSTSTPAPQKNFYKSNISRWFVQGSINHYNNLQQLSFIARVNYVGYSNVHTDYTPIEQEAYHFPQLGYPKWSAFLDIAGEKKIFFSKKQNIGLQISASTTLRLNKEYYNFFFYPFRLGIGVVYKSSLKRKPARKLG
jgi:hypothetical protein